MRVWAVLFSLIMVQSAFGQVTEDKGNPGSLLKPDYLNPLMDKVARRAGDILTIIIQEETVANYSASTTTNKSDNAGFTPTFVVDLFTRIFRPFSASSTSAQKGDGTTTHKNSMTSTMSVVVKAVLPNGNLLVEGARSLTTNKDTETIVLSGQVRPFDIQADNTILSTKLAEAKIAIAGKGTIQDRQRKGLINRLLDWLF